MSQRREKIVFRDRLFAEAVRSYEADGASPIEDAQALAAAREADGDLEKQLIRRAAALSIKGTITAALQQISTVLVWILVLGTLLALIAGAATARAAMGVNGSGVVNFYWVLAGVLGVQTLALFLWLAVMGITWLSSTRKHGASSQTMIVSLGSLAMGAAQWLAGKLHQQREHRAAVAAFSRVHGAGRIGRWSLSSITHGIWLAFNIGCLVMVIVLLSARQYTFVWETTILTEQHYLTLTRSISELPDAAGFATPDDAQIVASRRSEDVTRATAASEAWSSLLVGSLVLYGFAPRVLLLGLSLSCRRSATRAFRLDASQPGYARLQREFYKQPELISPDDDAGDETLGNEAAPGTATPRPLDKPAIVAVELNQPPTTWPPRLAGVNWRDLGQLENRDDQHKVITELTQAETEPATLVIVCDLASTPDRGIARLVSQLTSLLSQPAAMLLTGGNALRNRGMDADAVAGRVSVWRELAADAGLPPQRVIEVDLEHLTDTSASRIAQLLNEQQADHQEQSRRIEQAFDRIVQHIATHGSGVVGGGDEAALHRDIAAVYRSESSSWQTLLRPPDSFKGDVANTLRDRAEQVTRLLPERLRRSPKWLAAGAVSGALGCVAAAAVLSPIAIAALPTWSVIGAAVAAAMQPAGKSAGNESEIDHSDVVRSAALFALLLELQGHDEAAITQILDRVIADENDLAVTDADAAKRVLEQWQHRLDLARAEVLQ